MIDMEELILEVINTTIKVCTAYMVLFTISIGYAVINKHQGSFILALILLTALTICAGITIIYSEIGDNISTFGLVLLTITSAPIVLLSIIPGAINRFILKKGGDDDEDYAKYY